MKEEKSTQTQDSPQERREHLQKNLLSTIPATVVLLIGAYGSQIVQKNNVLLFTGIFLLGAFLTFIGEKKVIALMQFAQDRRYIELTMACHEFLAGNLKTKVAVRGHDKLSSLAETINLLLDQQRCILEHISSTPPVQPPLPSPPSPPSPQSTPFTPVPQNNEAELLKGQLTEIINDLAPITKGDLRIKLSTPDNLVGVIADTCNAFIEELSQFVKWTSYASQVVTTTSQSILDRSIEMAKNTENQMHRLSLTTNTIEEMASFMQHLSNSLHLSLDISKEVQHDMHTKIQPAERTSTTPVGQLLSELQRQTKLLEGLLHSSEETSTIAESLIGDLYAIAQQIYQSSVSALKTVKRLSELETLAERWYKIAGTFMVYEEEYTNAVKEPWLL